MISYINNLEGLREQVFANADWAPTQAAESKVRVTRWINTAISQIATEAPWLFEESRYVVVLEPPVSMGSTADTMSVTDDAWVMRLDLLAGDADAVAWETNRKWDGRLLAIQDPDDEETWHVLRIREVWESASVVYVSLERPWPNVTDEGLTWKLLSQEVALPEDVIEVRSASVFMGSSALPLAVAGQEAVEQSLLSPHPDASEGQPRIMYRREPQQLQQPNYTPTLTERDEVVVPWVGPEPTGEFEYCFTYVQGRQEARKHLPGPPEQGSMVGTKARYAPYWESAPSPASEPITLPASGAGAIEVALPDYDFMVGFGNASTTRYHHAGVKKRVYRRRLQDLGSPKTLDPSDKFYLIAEVDGHTTTWTDDGTQTPDRKAPLAPVQQYKTLGFYPVPDKRYEVSLRVVARPQPLVDDQDVPRIPADASEIVVNRALAHLYKAAGNPAMAAVAMQDYQRALGNLQKRHGTQRPGQRPRQRPTTRFGQRTLPRVLRPPGA